jgi:hypothetical protein
MDGFGVPEQAVLQKLYCWEPLTDVVSSINSQLSIGKLGKNLK